MTKKLTKAMEQKIKTAISKTSKYICRDDVEITFINDCSEFGENIFVVNATVNNEEYEAIVECGNIIEVNWL